MTRCALKPTALVSIGLWILYLAIVATVSKINGVPYDELGDSSSNLLRGAVLSLVIAGLIIAGLSAWMGWFGAAMHDQHRVRAWWMLIAPVLVVGPKESYAKGAGEPVPAVPTGLGGAFGPSVVRFSGHRGGGLASMVAPAETQ